MHIDILARKGKLYSHHVNNLQEMQIYIQYSSHEILPTMYAFDLSDEQCNAKVIIFPIYYTNLFDVISKTLEFAIGVHIQHLELRPIALVKELHIHAEKRNQLMFLKLISTLVFNVIFY